MFLILIVASAVVIYLLSRAEDGDRATPVSPETTSIQGAQTESSRPGWTETPAPTSAAEATASVRGDAGGGVSNAPGHKRVVFRQAKREQEQYELTYGEKETITADMTYQLENGCISSVEITFELPYQPDSKSKSAIDTRLRRLLRRKRACSRAR